MSSRSLAFTILLGAIATLCADPPTVRTPRSALQEFGDLIGTWRGTGNPAGSRAEAQQKFWTEKMTWEWHFKGDDASLKVAFEKSKHFTAGELRYVPGKDLFTFTATTPEKETLTYAGTLHNKVLTLEHESGQQRLVFTFLHPNRFLYRYDVKPAGRSLFSKQWSVGATKEGEPFAVGDGRPECIVSGGAGTTAVVYQGKTYYVCCSGCRSEFNENPAKYVAEYAAKKVKSK